MIDINDPIDKFLSCLEELLDNMTDEELDLALKEAKNGWFKIPPGYTLLLDDCQVETCD